MPKPKKKKKGFKIYGGLQETASNGFGGFGKTGSTKKRRRKKKKSSAF